MSYEKGQLFVVTDKYSYKGWVESMTKCIGQVVRSIGEHNDFSCKCETEAQGDWIPSCIANKEAQRKDLTQALKDYAEILRTVDSMREKEETKKEARGSGSVPERMM